MEVLSQMSARPIVQPCLMSYGLTLRLQEVPSPTLPLSPPLRKGHLSQPSLKSLNPHRNAYRRLFRILELHTRWLSLDHSLHLQWHRQHSPKPLPTLLHLDILAKSVKKPLIDSVRRNVAASSESACVIMSANASQRLVPDTKAGFPNRLLRNPMRMQLQPQCPRTNRHHVWKRCSSASVKDDKSKSSLSNKLQVPRFLLPRVPQHMQLLSQIDLGLCAGPKFDLSKWDQLNHVPRCVNLYLWLSYLFPWPDWLFFRRCNLDYCPWWTSV